MKDITNKALLLLCIVLLVILIYNLANPRVIYNEPVVNCPSCNVTPGQCESTKIITRFVCSDSRVVNSSELCIIDKVLPELEPVLTNENNTFIEKVEVKPACVGGYKGGYIFYEVQSPADNVTYQLREENNAYEDVLNSTGLFRSYKYFVICEDRCPKRGDFSLKANTRYVVRIKFERQMFYNRTEYSNEYIINLMPESEYMTKQC